MRIRSGTALWLAFAGLYCLPLGSAEPQALIRILGDELERNFKILKEKATPPPYFISYSVTENETAMISATQGALLSDSGGKSRQLDVSIRIGSPELDNYHLLNGRLPIFTSGGRIALEDNANAIRQALWRETDRIYRLGSQRVIRIQTDLQVKVEDEDAPLDFSPAAPVLSSTPPPATDLDTAGWATRLPKLSGEFAEFPRVLSSRLTLVLQRQTKYVVNTEGTRLVHGYTASRLSINAVAKAHDGMDLSSSESFEANLPKGLPSDERILAAIRKVAEDLSKMADAPPVDPYVAPAILSGRAAGVFFHEIFGHRVEGHRLRNPTEGQTFGASLDTPVLPEFLSVIFDPTLRRFEGRDLMGWYDYDDEAVKARRVAVVEDGVMKTFLMSRTAVPGISASNGHGRRQPGREVVSRQSNLIVESTQQVSAEVLREMLIAETKRQNKEYGFYFDQVTGGFTTTGRRGIQAFKVIPLVVYRVYPDGRPDELVRGADVVGTPLAAFSKIVATGNEAGIFNGYCGAESGNIPVSAVSPALLVTEIEIQRRESSQNRGPLLPRPVATKGATR